MNSINRSLKALRGATQLDSDDQKSMDDAVPELLESMLVENGLDIKSVISAILTSTPDLKSCFPAGAARRNGWADVPLLCAQEVDVDGAMARVVRVLLHVEARGDKPVSHVYLRGTHTLRTD